MQRRNVALVILALLLCESANAVQQWDIFELSLRGAADDQSFTAVNLTAQFTSGETSMDVHGFYDGDGVYRIRFMPPSVGKWMYETHSDRAVLDHQRGEFVCDAPTALNHGPVR